MSNGSQYLIFDNESFEDRIDNLFRELELAIKWQRPSVLFAIYKSDYVREEVEAVLRLRFEKMDQQLIKLDLQSDFPPTFISGFKNLAELDKSIVIVNGLSNVLGNSGNTRTITPGMTEEFFVENNVRIVFWLTEEQEKNIIEWYQCYLEKGLDCELMGDVQFRTDL